MGLRKNSCCNICVATEKRATTNKSYFVFVYDVALSDIFLSLIVKYKTSDKPAICANERLVGQ